MKTSGKTSEIRAVTPNQLSHLSLRPIASSTGEMGAGGEGHAASLLHNCPLLAAEAPRPLQRVSIASVPSPEPHTCSLLGGLKKCPFCLVWVFQEATTSPHSGREQAAGPCSRVPKSSFRHSLCTCTHNLLPESTHNLNCFLPTTTQPHCWSQSVNEQAGWQTRMPQAQTLPLRPSWRCACTVCTWSHQFGHPLHWLVSPACTCPAPICLPPSHRAALYTHHLSSHSNFQSTLEFSSLQLAPFPSPPNSAR